MKIGIDARLWSQTGVGRYIRSLFTTIEQFDKKNEYIWFFQKAEYDSIVLPTKRWKKVQVDIKWHTLSEQILLPFIFLRENLDLLHFPYFTNPILYPGKTVVTIHDLIYDHYKTGKTSTLPYPVYMLKKIGYHFVLWATTKKANKIFTLSQDAKKEICDHYKVDTDKIVVTYESGKLEDSRKFFPSGQYNFISKLSPYILYVGNAHPHKNVESLINAMEYVKEKMPKLKLVLLGTDSFFYPKIKQYIDQKRLHEEIYIPGEIPNKDIAAWYHFACFFISASHMEGFGIPPLEAMSVGCPGLLSDIPVFHEINQDAAVYFDQTNPEKIAHAIIKLVTDKKLLAQKSILGYEQVKKYSWEKMTRETVETYHQVLSSK